MKGVGESIRFSASEPCPNLSCVAMQEREATDGITQEMIDSFGVSVGNKWDPARTKQYIEARQELLNDEETKAEITKLGERCVSVVLCVVLSRVYSLTSIVSCPTQA